MPKKVYGLISTLCMISVIFCSWVGLAQSPQPLVRLTTVPSIDQIRPFEAEATEWMGSGSYKPPVQLSLQAVDAQGQPLKDARMHVQIFTPPKTPWLTTDFPIVEGTKLLDMEGNAPTGQLQLQQTLPIRGTYTLRVTVTPIAPNGFPPIKQTLTLAVQENVSKYLNLGILVVILLAAGLGGGWVIGSRQPLQPGEVVPQRVRLLLSGAIGVAIVALLFVNIRAEFAQSDESHGSHEHRSHEVEAHSKPATLQSQGLAMQLSGDTSATVGQPAQLQVRVINTKTQQPVTDVALKVTTTQLENNWVAFAYEGTPDRTGTLTWEQGFFDGAPHNIDVEVLPQANSTRRFQPFQVAQTVTVEGVAPPLAVQWLSMTYFTSIVGMGLLLGLWLGQCRTPMLGRLWKRSFS